MYWKQSLTWEQASAPDFPRLIEQKTSDSKTLIIHIVISHLPPKETTAIHQKWKASNPSSRVLIAFGGKEQDFKDLPSEIDAVWIPDAALRTQDHARERQDYSGIFREANTWIDQHFPEATHVHIVEYDVIPVIPNAEQKLLETLEQENADVIGYGVLDISGSVHPHHSHELSNTTFLDFLKTISHREVKERILTMLGCSTFWTRECFRAVATLCTPRVYLEIGMATLPHHLGYRVRPIPFEQQAFVSFEGDFSEHIETFKQKGAWFVHPCKTFWKNEGASRKPKLMLCSHTYGAVANRAKATALSEWFDVRVCFPDMSGLTIMGKDGSAQDGTIENAPYEIRRLKRWPRSASFTKCLMSGLFREIRQWQPDVILCEEEPWSIARWQCRISTWFTKKRPIFVEFTWENLPRQGFKGFFLKQIYRLAAVTTHGVVCGNRGAERLFADAGLSAERCMRTGQLGVDPEEHPVRNASEKAEWKKSLQFPEEAFVVGFCGRFVEEKGILDLVEAVRRVREQGVPVHLVFLGAGPLETQLLQQHRGQPWFRILPPVTHAEVPGIISHFDLFVLPSKPQLDPSKGLWEEQFGHVLIEAMMSAVPCIGSASGGIPEVLEDSQVLFTPGAIEEIQKLIHDYSTDETARQLLGSRQRNRTATLWTHHALAERYQAFIKRFLGSA